MIYLFLLFLNPAVMAQSAPEKESVPTDWLDQATFTNNNSVAEAEYHQNIGLAVPNFLGLGAIYKKPISEQRTLWILATYQADTTVYFKPQEGENASTFLETGWKEKSRYQLMLGVDQILHPVASKRWGILLGLGVGFNISKYEYEYSPYCVFFCNPETSAQIQQAQNDAFGFIGSRIGLIWMNQKIWGTTGHVAASITPLLLRTGKELVFKNYLGNNLQTETNTTFLFEVTIDI